MQGEPRRPHSVRGRLLGSLRLFFIFEATILQAAFYKGFRDSEDRPFLGRIDPLSGHIRDGIIRDPLLKEVGQLVPGSMCSFSYMEGEPRKPYQTRVKRRGGMSFLLYAGTLTEAAFYKGTGLSNFVSSPV